MSFRTCPICKKEYEDGGNSWKKQCYDCYKHYRCWKRIQPIGYKENIYMTHPNVTKEELDQYIRENGHETGWGAEEIDLKKSDFYEKWKIWRNSTNYD